MATGAGADPSLPPLWQAMMRLDAAGVQSAAAAGADLNARNASGDTPLLYISRAGHYKFKPSEIPAALITAGADLEAKDAQGLTPLQVSLLAGWQNLATLYLSAGADRSGVPAIKGRLTCPDCKKVVLDYGL